MRLVTGKDNLKQLIACKTEKRPSLRDWFDNLLSEDLRRIGARIDNRFQ